MDKDLIEEWLQKNTPKKCKSNEKGIKKSEAADAQSIDTRYTILEYRPNLTKKEIEEAKTKKEKYIKKILKLRKKQAENLTTQQKLWANVKKKKYIKALK